MTFRSWHAGAVLAVLCALVVLALVFVLPGVWMDARAAGGPVLFVSVLNVDGSAPVRGGNIQLWKDGVLVDDRPNDSGYLQFDTRAPGHYCVRPVPPVGYRSLEQVLCQADGDHLVFYYVSMAPTATPTALQTPWPTPTTGPTPTVDPFVLPPELHVEFYALDGRLVAKGTIILEPTPLPQGSRLP